MEKLSLTSVMESLKDNVLPIRQKFVAGRRHFVSRKENALADSFLELLCTEKVCVTLTNEQFGQILEAVFNDGKREYPWLGKYCDMLVRSLNCIKTKEHTDELAMRYDKHLQTILVPEFKKLIGNAKQPPAVQEVWDWLTDIYKLSTGLFAYYSGKKFTLNITREDMDALEKTLRDNKIAAQQPADIFHKPINSIDPYHHDERQYAVLLSWILTEIICDQDGLNQKEDAE